MRRLFKTALLFLMLVFLFNNTPVKAVEYSDFSDLSASGWYRTPVNYCILTECMNGTSSKTFEPNSQMTRAMFVTVLYRMSGDSVSPLSVFRDVPSSSWYTSSVRWAKIHGYIDGCGGGKFEPDDSITREQAIKILWSIEHRPSAQSARFSDHNRISSWALDAVSWARSSGLVEGRGNNRFVPQGLMTRAEAAAILYRYESMKLGFSPAAEVPILSYHSFLEKPIDGTASISIQLFKEQMDALSRSGYQTITYTDLVRYVDDGIPLPGKPIMITFDDGYLNNISVAGPILRQYGFHACISVIGTSVGTDTYKETGIPITPHFSYDEVLPYLLDGTFEIQSHSYDMHQVSGLDSTPIRYGVLPFPNEDPEKYREAFTMDLRQSASQIKSGTGADPFVFTYPYGAYCDQSEEILKAMGFRISVTTRSGTAFLVYHHPETLFLLPRYGTSNVSPAQLIKLLNP